LKVKKHCYSGDKISESYDFGRKRKTTLDLKYQTLKLREVKKQGRLQHRLQLGIPLPCEAGRTVDQVPKLGKWSHRLKSREKSKEKDRKGKNFRLITQKFFRTQILFPNTAEVTFAIFPFSLLSLGNASRQS
jgi:hypothetical protein